MSNEADCCKELMAKWCVGNGIDIGTNGYPPIVPNAITVDKYSGGNGNFPVQLVWDAFESLPFRDNTLDFVFSSHCLEDAKFPQNVLKMWLNAIKPGGYCMLCLPDQAGYVAHCKKHGATPNRAHQTPDLSLQWLKDRLPNWCKVVFEQWPIPGNAYSFAIVIQKI